MFTEYQRLIMVPCCLIFATHFLVGCGGGDTSGKKKASVTITVTSGGQPVTEGLVTLDGGKTGEAAGADLNSTGVATLPEVTLGNYTVTVTPPLPKVAAPAPGQKLPPPKDYANIPAKVRRADTSTLKAEVKAGKNEFKFDLAQ